MSESQRLTSNTKSFFDILCCLPVTLKECNPDPYDGHEETTLTTVEDRVSCIAQWTFCLPCTVGRRLTRNTTWGTGVPIRYTETTYHYNSTSLYTGANHGRYQSPYQGNR